jgi:hypothetical protein
MGSAETARSKELGPRELLRLDPWATGWGSSSWELLKLRGSCSLMMEARLLPTGVLVREIQTPSTSMPLWIARMPNGISSLVSSCTWVTGCASSISGVEARLPLSTLLYLRTLFLSYQSLSRPKKTVTTIPQPSTWVALASAESTPSRGAYKGHLLPQVPALEELIAFGFSEAHVCGGEVD